MGVLLTMNVLVELGHLLVIGIVLMRLTDLVVPPRQLAETSAMHTDMIIAYAIMVLRLACPIILMSVSKFPLDTFGVYGTLMMTFDVVFYVYATFKVTWLLM